MEKEFIPENETKQLFDLGLTESTFTPLGGHYNGSISKIVTTHHIPAPTFSQAFRWFREKYGITSWIEEDKHGFSYNLRGADFTQTIKDTYEEAELACLRKLIEIVKQNL